MKRIALIKTCTTYRDIKRGLMGYTSIPENSGMLFDFGEPGPRSFWMKNTTIPLQIAFIGLDSRIVQISRMKPLCLESVVCETPCRFVLEVEDGTFDQLDIREGDKATVHQKVNEVRFVRPKINPRINAVSGVEAPIFEPRVGDSLIQHVLDRNPALTEEEVIEELESMGGF